MRIFQVIEPSSNTAVPANRAWLRLLHEPLLDLGHDVHLVSASEGRTAMRRRSRRRRERFSERLLAEFQREHTRRPLHLFFAYLMDGMVEPGAIDEIRPRGRKDPRTRPPPVGAGGGARPAAPGGEGGSLTPGPKGGRGGGGAARVSPPPGGAGFRPPPPPLLPRRCAPAGFGRRDDRPP